MRRSHHGRPGAPTRRLTMSFQSRWGRSHSAYISENVTIHYRWCNRFKSSLPVLRRMRREQGDWLICETPEGNALAVPVWMTDPAICAGFSSGPPLVSVAALRELRAFLDALQPAAVCDKPSGNTFSLECLDEAKPKDETKSNRAVLPNGSDQRPSASRFADGTPGRTGKGSRQSAVKRSRGQRQSSRRSSR